MPITKPKGRQFRPGLKDHATQPRTGFIIASTVIGSNRNGRPAQGRERCREEKVGKKRPRCQESFSRFLGRPWGAKRAFQSQSADDLVAPNSLAERTAALHATTQRRQLRLGLRSVDVLDPARPTRQGPSRQQRLFLRRTVVSSDADCPHANVPHQGQDSLVTRSARRTDKPCRNARPPAPERT
jgi:hypothetical protein